MSRYDQPAQEPDYDRYEPKPVEDSDVPDFDAEELPDPVKDNIDRLGGESLVKTISRLRDEPQRFPGTIFESVDPAEHAAHALIDALATLEKEIASNFELERAWVLKHMLARAWDQIEQVNTQAMNKIDLILERRR